MSDEIGSYQRLRMPLVVPVGECDKNDVPVLVTVIRKDCRNAHGSGTGEKNNNRDSLIMKRIDRFLLSCPGDNMDY